MKTFRRVLIGLLIGVGSAFAAAAPAFEGVRYAAADAGGTDAHRADIYLPDGPTSDLPVVLWTAGSAWLQNNGRSRADWLVDLLVPQGYAVVGVSVRSSGQATFPAQLHDIKAAIRFVRANAETYGFDAGKIAVVGTSSGGWVASMAASTSGQAALDGRLGFTDVSSAIQAAIAFWPPTDFLAMDRWAIEPCEQLRFGGTTGFCHDAASSPESRLVGCPIQSCPDQVRAANPMAYVGPDSAPIFILHGQSDPLVPHQQGESLYQAYNKACLDAVFVSVPKLGHGPLSSLADPAVVEAATRRSTTAEGCVVTNPMPVDFTPAALVEFLDRQLKPGRAE